MQKLRIRRRSLWMTLVAAVCLVLATLATPGTQGQARAASGGWSTSGANIVTPSGSTFISTGANWYGFETTGYVAHGLYAKDYKYIVDEVKKYGYNTIRIPFSNQMWETNPIPNANTISACPTCRGTHSRDILANIVNYAGSLGLHVILDNHRSEAGNSAESNGLWYATARGTGYTEQAWLRDWQQVQQWVHGIKQAQDNVPVTYLAADGYPTVLGYELRNEPHTPARTAYLQGATWGTGDGVDPTVNANPNPFAQACVASSTCHDWRLAAERAGDTLLGDAATKGWNYPLIIVDGVSQFPLPGGNAANGPYDYYWWGGQLQGVKGTTGNPGAPVLLNAGGSASALGAAVSGNLLYSAHDFGPAEFQQGWFNANTTQNSLADVWNSHWGYINAAGQAPVVLSEFGTGNTAGDLSSTSNGSQGQWFTDLVNFIKGSYGTNPAGPTNLSWTYWALNGEDSYGLLGSDYAGLANQTKEYTYLCAIQRGPFAIPAGSGSGQCGSTGALPGPH